MKRDMDLIRKLLLDIEERAGVERWAIEPSAEGHSEREIAYHVRLLYEAGFLNVIDVSSMDGEAYQVTGLTWAGHDFLEAARDDKLWRRAMVLIQEKMASAPFEVLKALLVKLAAGELGM